MIHHLLYNLNRKLLILIFILQALHRILQRNRIFEHIEFQQNSDAINFKFTLTLLLVIISISQLVQFQLIEIVSPLHSFSLSQMHSSLAPQMEASLESKFTAAFEQQNASSGSKSQLCNGGNHKRSSSSTATSTTTATPNTESSGEKTVSFRKGNDLESFEALSSLFANGLFTDLVICCSGKMFKCHRVVMAAASLYIRDALSAFYNNNVEGNSGCNSHCNTVMILPKEIKMNDMEAILRFIYDGHVEVKVDSIESFLKSARMLNIKGLSNVNIVFNNNGTSTTDESVDEGIDEASIRKNNGYSKNHNSLMNGHAGMNSPPPSPPSLNSSLASLKALTANQTCSPVPLINGNHSKHLNGLGHYRNHIKRDQSPLRNDQPSLLSHNLIPAHQSSTPKSIFANGNLFQNNVRLDSTNSIVPSGGSRRKQKFPTNIPPTFLSDIPPLAAALYNTWLNSEEDEEEEIDDNYEEKKLVIKDESSNDCSTTGDNLSNASHEVAKQPSLPFGVPLGAFNPQIPCMIEVEADPTNFPTYCHDVNDNSTLLQTANKRRRHFKSGFPENNIFNNKKLKLPYPSTTGVSSPNSDVSIKPSSPLMPTISQQQSSADLLLKKHGGMRSSLPSEKPLFGSYSTVKTAAGSNPSASPSSSISGSGSWTGNKWKCDICNKYYGNKQTLKEHMDYFHSNREEQIYICNICNKEYTWRKSLMKHYRDIHQMRNTPALAEINRQLAQLASAKARSQAASNMSLSSPVSDDTSSLQYVSISSNRKSNPKSISSNRSDIDLEDNENIDAVPEEEDDEDSNEEVEVENSNADSQEESLPLNCKVSLNCDDNKSVELPTNGSDDPSRDSSSTANVENSPNSSPSS